MSADAGDGPVAMREWLRGYGAAWAVLAISLLTTGIFCYLANIAEREKLASLYQYRTDRIQREMQDILSGYESTLRGVTGLIEASGGFNRSTWRAYFRRFVGGPVDPGLRAVGYAVRVRADERGAHEAQVRTEGIRSYAVQPEGERSLYFPVAYALGVREPSPIVLGLDLGTEPATREALDRAAATGGPATAATADGGPLAGAMWRMIQPVYRNDPPRPASLGVRPTPDGFVVLAVDVPEMMGSVIGHDSGLIAYRLTMSGLDRSRPVVESEDFLTRWEDAGRQGLRREALLAFGDREWRLELAALPEFREAVGSQQQAITIVAGVLVSVLLFAIAATMAQMRREALAIAERRTAELRAALATHADSEARLRAVFDTVIDGIVTIDEEGIIQTANPAAERIFGYRVDEITGRDVSMLMGRPHREHHASYLRNFLATGEARIIGIGREVDGLRKDGTQVPIELSIGEMRIGGRRYFCGIVRDITERRRAEQALALNERKLRSYVNQSLDGLLVVDRDGRFVETNPAVCAMLGYSEQELLEKTIADVLYGDAGNLDAGRRHFERVLATGTSSGEVTLQRKDGSVVVVDINAVALGADRFLGVLRDVTERRRAEDQLQQEREQLEERVRDRTQVLTQINEALQQEIAERRRIEFELVKAREQAESAAAAKAGFLANMSHEIRTPLNAVIGLAAMLEETALTPEQRSYLEGIRVGSDSLLGIITDILDFSKIDSGALELESRTFDLASCIEEALELLAPKASEKRLELLYTVAEDVPVMLAGDMTRLRQILVNLVGNAIKFTDRGEVAVEASMSRAHEGGLLVAFAVRDTGIGIAEPKFPQLFRPFTQADSSTTRKYGGTGLGLAICARLVHLMGGSIWVESVEGRGSTFFFTIRAHPVQSPATPPHAIAGRREFAGRRALVVDDNHSAREALAERLRRWGMEVVEAGSAESALAMLAATDRVDVALIDQDMPVSDGFALARDIAAATADRRAPALVLLAATAEARCESADASPSLFSAEVRKPVKVARLHAALLNALGRGNQEQEAVTPTRLDATLGSRLPLRILVAEDSDINRRLTLTILRKLGYEADAVENGADAVAGVQQHGYDIVLMDLQMPRMDGIEATRRIRELPVPQPRIVAMTANALQEDRDRCLAAGMDDFITKPVLPVQVQQLLERWGARRADGRQKAGDAAGGTEALLDQRTLKELASLDEPGKPSLRAALVRQYLEDAPAAIREVEQLIRDGELVLAAAKAHRLAGASVSIGACGVAELCRRFEVSVHAGQADEDAIAALPARLEATGAALLAVIA